MADQLSTLNNALAELGEAPSDTLDLNVAKENPRKMLRFMDKARDQVLARHPFNAALTYVTLTRATGDGHWKYAYRFALPADCLRVFEVDGCVKWEAGTWKNPSNPAVETAVIWADAEGPIDVGYARRLGWSAIPVHLTTAVEKWLAGLACWAINGDRQKADDLKKEAVLAVADAARFDGTQLGGQDPILPSEFASLRASV